jgi:circadian clock protein KaiC
MSKQTAGPDRLGTGVDGLDTVLGGGLPSGRIYLVQGEPGTGKTTLALQFLLEGARLGEPVLYVTLSETEDELAQVAASHGWSLDGVDVCDLSAVRDITADTQYTLFHPSEVELDETTRVVLERVERSGPRRVVFDSLSEMRLLARDALRYRRQVLALKQFFVGRACTVLMLDDLTSESSDRQLESLAHGVLRLAVDAPDYGSERRRLQIAKLRGVRFSGGFHDITIETGGLNVFPRLVAAANRNRPPSSTLSTGIDGLDALLGGGMTAASSTLIIGPAGAGKTTLAMAFATAQVAGGAAVAVFTFDEGRETIVARADAIGLGASEQLETGRLSMRQVDPAELSPGQFAHEVMTAVARDGVSVVVIDSLNGYLASMADERSLPAHLHELLAALAHYGVATVLVMAQSGLIGSDMRSPVDVSYVADTVLLLRYFEAHGEVRQAISVLKKRTGSHERTIRELRIDTSGVRIGRALREFRGVLTGTPEYHGASAPLLEDRSDATRD